MHGGSEYAYEGNRDSSIADKPIENQHKAKFEVLGYLFFPFLYSMELQHNESTAFLSLSLTV